MEYLDIIIIAGLIILVVIFFRNFRNVLYLLGIIEVGLRLIRFVANNIGANDISRFLIKTFPSSMFSIIDNYSSGILNTILSWILTFLFLLWLFYLIKYFFKKGR